MKEFIQLLGYVKKYKQYVALNILSNVLMAIFMVVSIPAVIPFFQILLDRQPPVVDKPDFSLSNLAEYVKYLYSDLILNSSKEEALTIVCIVLVVLFFMKNLFRYLSMFFMAFVRNGVTRDVRQAMFQKFIDLPFAFFSRERKGDLISRITTDVQEIENSILRVLETTFREPIVLIGSIAFMIYISPTLTLFVFVLLIFTIFIIGGVSRTLKKKSLRAQRMLGRLVSIVEESLGGMRIIKAFNAQRLQAGKFREENDSYRRLMNRILWRRDLSSPLSEFLGVSVVIVLLWYGSRQVFSGELAAETFFAFIVAFYYVINPAKAFAAAYYSIQKGLAAVERINEVMLIEDKIDEKPNAVPFADFRESIEFRNVSFSYPESETEVLKDVNLTIRKGQIIALVGSSGSGKSTLADLIPRFHDVKKGAILIDGVDIRDYRIHDLRARMGIVSQDAILFNDTIRNNIVFSTDEKSDHEVDQAARHAHADTFIAETEHGYDSVIGDRGMKLSGGQRQRLTIARALLNDPPILILDEATAALDSESERLVQDALEHVMRGRTSIIIAHRLSTIRHADAIYVMKEGRIVEHGTHEELQKLDGEYNKFVALQTFE
ncbi:MAG: ABC transporter ATP-binding protein [Saprospiraceae bacterium]|nr:ABC transporter ATP-binding protein [Saprospiraceae bacterium]